MAKIIKFAYNDVADLILLEELIRNKDFELISFDENKLSERKKAYSLKNTYGAKMSPLLVLERKDLKNKVFYTESGNVLDNFKNFLNGTKKVDTSYFEDFVKKCKDNEMSLEEIKVIIEKYYENKSE